jgi:spermidine synthase
MTVAPPPGEPNTPDSGTVSSTRQPPLEERSRGTVRLYLLLTTITAAAALAVEIIAGRMIAPYLGMSLYTWTAIIAIVLAGFSLGHWWGGIIAGWPSVEAERAVAWALLAAAATTALSLILIRVLAGPVIAAGLGAVPTILVITTLLFFAPSLFVGIPSPVLTKLAIDADPAAMARTLGIFYAAGAFGSILGTLVSGYLLIAWLGTIRALLAIAALYLAMSAMLFWHARHRGRGTLTTPLVSAALLAALMLPTGFATAAFRSNCTHESQYYCIRVDDISEQLGTTAHVLVLDHLAHGINLRDTPAALVSPYVMMQNALVETHLPRSGADMRAYFVGGGAYTLPRAWSATVTGAQITVAELDPAVTCIARSQMWLGTPDNVTVRHADARATLATDPAATYDVIIGDAFHDIAVPPHLVTHEFMAVIKSRLKPHGIYVMNVVDHSQRPRFALSIVKTLKTLFPIVEIWGDARPDDLRATFVIAALRRPSPAASITLGQESTWRRWSNAKVETGERTLQAQILTDDFAPVDRLIGVE